MNRLQKIQYEDGSLGFQEIDQSGRLLRIYDADGEQRSRLADADRYPIVRFRFVCDLGEFADSDGFWRLVNQSGDF